MQKMKLFFVILVLGLSFSTVSSAGPVKIAFTATLEEPAVPYNSGFKYPVTKLRLTQKDFLAYLSTFYGSFPVGSYLSYDNGTFYIKGPTGNFLNTVSSSYLSIDFPPSTTIKSGFWAPPVGNYTELSQMIFSMDINPSYNFEVTGMYAVKRTPYFSQAIHNFQAILVGDGIIQGKNCVISGTLKIKYFGPV